MYMNINSNTGSTLKNFNVLQKLGQGSFANVYKVQRIDDKKLYAMKKVKIGQMKQKQRDNALNQVRVLASISHSNIINYKQAFFDDPTQSLCIVMELADAGDIQKKINDHLKNHTYFTQNQIWQALIQMSKGLKALHQINILHRDLKCANVFCTKDGKFKLGDLNVSKVAKRGMARTQTGTPYYTSPQVWKDRPYDSKCDIWSLGCVVYEMASLNPPFRANNLKQLYIKIQRGIFQRIPSFYSQDLSQIINQCLKVSSNSRPSANQILQNPIVIKNTPRSEKYIIDNQQTKKTNLINTILCPRNLKSLKMALPGAKYQQSPPKINRANSVDTQKQNNKRNNNSIINQIPRIINSPKIGQLPSRQLKYAIQRRPSSQRNIFPYIKKQPVSQHPQRQNSKNIIRNNSRLIRNNSVDSIRKKKQQSSILDNKPLNDSQQKRKQIQKNNYKIQNNKGFIQDISNRCKNIKQKVQNLLNKNISQKKYQKISNSIQKKYNNIFQDNNLSKQKKQKQISKDKLSKNISRNNSVHSIQHKYHGIQKNYYGNADKSMEKNKSMDKMERPNSKKVFLPYRR